MITVCQFHVIQFKKNVFIIYCFISMIFGFVFVFESQYFKKKIEKTFFKKHFYFDYLNHITIIIIAN